MPRSLLRMGLAGSGGCEMAELNHDGEQVVASTAGDDPSVRSEVQDVDPGNRYRPPSGRKGTELARVRAFEQPLDGHRVTRRGDDSGAGDGIGEGRRPRHVPVPHVRLAVDGLALGILEGNSS